MKTMQFKLFSLLTLAILFFASCNTGNNIITPPKNENSSENTIIESEKEGFTIVLKDANNSINKTIETALINTFHKVYSKMVNDFNTNAIKKVTVIIDPSYDGVAYAHNGEIVVSSKYINKKPKDTDLLTHELMHIVQSYPGGPSWLIEGIADYARYTYGINNKAAGWSLPSYSSNQNYTDAYRVTARFLNWVKLKYDNDIINKLDDNLRNGTYTNNLWVDITGNTLPDLWSIYSNNPI